MATISFSFHPFDIDMTDFFVFFFFLEQMEDYRRSIATQLIDEHVRQHRQLKLSDQSDVVSQQKSFVFGIDRLIVFDARIIFWLISSSKMIFEMKLEMCL